MFDDIYQADLESVTSDAMIEKEDLQLHPMDQTEEGIESINNENESLNNESVVEQSENSRSITKNQLVSSTPEVDHRRYAMEEADDIRSFNNESVGEFSEGFEAYYARLEAEGDHHKFACDVSKLESIFEDENSSPEEARFAYYQLCLLLDRNPALSPEECRFAAYYTNTLPVVTDKKVDLQKSPSLAHPRLLKQPESEKNYVPIKTKLLEQSRNALSKTGSFQIFLLFAACGALIEPVLVAFHQSFVIFYLQVAVLGFSTVLVAVGHYLSMLYYDIQHYEYGIENPDNLAELSDKSPTKVSNVKVYDTEVMDEVKYVPLTFWQLSCAVVDDCEKVELLILAYGWLTLFLYSDIAPFRCVRIFRLFLYLTYFPPTATTTGVERPSHSTGWNFRGYLLNVGLFYLEYIRKVAVEILPALLRGIFVLSLYFFTTYIMAVVMWRLESSLDVLEVQLCHNVSNCFITMMRLSLYDSSGFDFLAATMNADRPGMVVILILYMCFTSIVLLNGLVGIFAVAFARDHVDKEHTKIKAEERQIFLDSLQFFKDEMGNLRRLENRLNAVQLKINGISNGVIALRNENKFP